MAGTAPFRLYVTALAAAVALAALGGEDVEVAAMIVTAAAASGSVLLGVRLHRPANPLPWRILALSLAMSSGSGIAYGVVEPYAGPLALLLLLVGYLPILGFLFLLRSSHGPLTRADGLTDVGILAVALMIPHWAVVIAPSSSSDTPMPQLIAAAGAVFFDVFVLLALLVVLIPAWRLPAYSLLLASSALILVADEVMLATLDESAMGPSPLLWTAGFGLCGAAALHPSMRSLSVGDGGFDRRLTMGRLLLLAVPLAVMPMLGALDMHRLGHDELAWVPAFAGAVTILILMRMTNTVRTLDRMHVQLARQHEELLRVDELKRDLIRTVSHELRTPLTAIRGHAGLLAIGDGVTDGQRESVGAVRRGTVRLTRLVEDLMLSAEAQAGTLELRAESVSIGDLLHDCVEGARPAAAAHGVSLVAPDPAAGVVVHGDPDRLAQVVDNLLSNALNFTPCGGRVTARAEVAGAHALIEVADTGVGVASAEREQIFQPFVRGEDAVAQHVPGTGLGLHLVKEIVDAHGGSVQLDSLPAFGTVFRVSLPLAAIPAPAVPEEAIV